MRPAVLMMYRDEADILQHSLAHWYALGVRDFYLCDNLSEDKSEVACIDFKLEHELAMVIHYRDQRPDWPGRERINQMKEQAIAEGCDWIFPADADEFLQMGDRYYCIQDFCAALQSLADSEYCSFEVPYLNIFPNGKTEWQRPQRKVFGKLRPDWIISMGNHLIENADSIELHHTQCYYRHYPIRSYQQFRRKMINWWTAFHNGPHQTHEHAKHWHKWQEQGETYIENLYNELLK